MFLLLHKHATLTNTIVDGFSQIRIMCSSDMTICGLLFQWAKRVDQVQSGHHHHLIEI